MALEFMPAPRPPAHLAALSFSRNELLADAAPGTVECALTAFAAESESRVGGRVFELAGATRIATVVA
jgi:hypothetical protein